MKSRSFNLRNSSALHSSVRRCSRLMSCVRYVFVPSLLFAMVLIVNSTTSAAAEEEIKTENAIINQVMWSEVAKSGRLPSEGELVDDAEQGSVIKIQRHAGSAQLVRLAAIDQPGIEVKQYMLRGRVRYENVDAIGYLEMWNVFPEPKKGSYFSRTLAPSGPLGKIEGSSPWRDVQLPFFINKADFPAPERLEINVYLPGKGTVWLSNLEVVELPASAMPGAGMTLAGIMMWVSILIGTMLLISVVATGLAYAMTKGRASKPVGDELRRMQAMDIG